MSLCTPEKSTIQKLSIIIITAQKLLGVGWGGGQRAQHNNYLYNYFWAACHPFISDSKNTKLIQCQHRHGTTHFVVVFVERKIHELRISNLNNVCSTNTCKVFQTTKKYSETLLSTDHLKSCAKLVYNSGSEKLKKVVLKEALSLMREWKQKALKSSHKRGTVPLISTVLHQGFQCAPLP